MNKSRIDHAIHVLKTAPKPGKFDMTVWASLSSIERKTFQPGETVALNGCGTAGCAVGWIASDPLVRQEGLRLKFNSNWEAGIPFYKNKGGMSAAAAYFDIGESAAELLFYPLLYPDRHLKNPEFVIERMELLLASDEGLFIEMMDSIGTQLRE